jgi:N6-L-threonylcarbamoyladenine synthase
VPILEAALEEAELLQEDTQALPEAMRIEAARILVREPDLTEAFLAFVSECEPPDIDAIAVTAGPGLEPALWVGINFAKALGLVWNKPVVAVNHMEGHIFAALAEARDKELTISNIALPVLALLISGGHTELVVMNEWFSYQLVGQTRDDAVGEAFDKVARMMGLPYPGGPEISKLAELARQEAASEMPFTLPRPMLTDATCDFSFSGLKTAVLYLLKNKPELSAKEKQSLAHEFENAVTEVLWKKTARAIQETGAGTVAIGGGVSANTHIRRTFVKHMKEEFPQVSLRIPAAVLTTDNALMIAIAGFYRAQMQMVQTELTANGNLSLA